MAKSRKLTFGWRETVCPTACLLDFTKLCASKRLAGLMAAALVSLASQAMGASDRYTFSTSAAVLQETAREIVEVMVGDRSPLARPCRIYVVPDIRGADFLTPRALDQLAAALTKRLRESSYGEGCAVAKSIFLSRPQASADSLESLIQQLGGADAQGAVLTLAFYRWEELMVLGRLHKLGSRIVRSSGLLPIPGVYIAAAMPSNQKTAITTLRKAASSSATSTEEMERAEKAFRSPAKSMQQAGQVQQPSGELSDGSRKASTDRRYRVQVAALRSEAAARSEWRNIQANLRMILSNFDPHFERSETRDGVAYRVQVGSFTRHNEAAALCKQMKERNADCFVVER